MPTNRGRSESGKPPPARIPLFFLRDALNDARKGLGSKMLGTRRRESQCDIGIFDVVAARDFYHHR